MCVIFYSTNKDALPTLPQMRKMFKANSDGASFSFVKDGAWQTIKGFMRLKDVEAIYDTLEMADEVIGHFRLATHGKVNVHNCHPFSVVEDRKESSRCTNQSKGGVLYHNGILRGFGNAKFSDTLHFVTSVLAKVALPERMAILENTDGKFAYITPEGIVELYGDFEDDHFGCYFSNTYWDMGYNVLQEHDERDMYLYDDIGYAMLKDRTLSAVTELKIVDEVEN